ncbi:PH domain-containing protein [Ornithinimicrobium cerasi]|uniref:PH domain-containing protein n=1 Tax=Ornithinimicrobium cerasi TaxID=2248773 RepID=A0A285VRW9_9MICO|nr:PH domain-containing protein [Ornithinimicrobium cerasi]SOC56795.1 PH domain-containing protein [Ornithinimicrobium cerasi]
MPEPAPSLRISRRILDRYLLEDETPVVATRQHWAKLVEPFTTTLVALVAVGALTGQLDARAADLGTLLWVGWFVVLGRAVWRLLQWNNDWFVATDRRMLLVYGLFTQRVAMMPLNKVTDMNYGRSILGRLLGYGRFVLESAGQDQAMREIDFLPDPDEKYRRICAILFRDERRRGARRRQAVEEAFDDGVRSHDPFETSQVADERPGFTDRFDPDVVRVHPLRRARQDQRRWEPVERSELPPDWEWVENEARRARAATRSRTVAVDPDPTPHR